MWNSRVGMEREESNERRGGDLLNKEVVKVYSVRFFDAINMKKIGINWGKIGEDIIIIVFLI